MEILLDLENICSADEFYELLGENMALPAYFGRNLDALHDVLGDITKETRIRIIHTDGVSVMMPKFFRGLRRLAADIHEENEHVCIVLEDDLS